ncbi:MAG TPA: hypothetical protein VI978_00045 [Candidatus Paceibacterota bacterium]
MNFSWLLGHWLWFYVPVHAVIGILCFAWFNYSQFKKTESEFGLDIRKFRSYPFITFFCFLAGAVSGPFALLANAFFHFSGGVGLKPGLLFFGLILDKS